LWIHTTLRPMVWLRDLTLVLRACYTSRCANLAKVGIKPYHSLFGYFANLQMQPLVYLPFVLQYGIHPLHPHGVLLLLSLLKNNWTGFENLPKSKTVEKYLSDLKKTLEKTREFADKKC